MINEFITAFPSHTLMDVYNMPSQMFFIYYNKIPSALAIHQIAYIESHLLAKAKQYAEKGQQYKVDKEYKALLKTAQGHNV